MSYDQTTRLWNYEYRIYDILPMPPMDFIHRNGIAEARERHDALARRKYAKPFKWFKFNRARKATAK